MAGISDSECELLDEDEIIMEGNTPYTGAEDGLEDIMQYEEGGFHPVHIGDMLHERFEVVNKLGSGSFGMVWLCLDIKLDKWRAVKVMSANHSLKGKDQKVIRHLQSKASAKTLLKNHVAVPIEEFWIEGPNGSHLCLIMPLLGCGVMSWRSRIHWTQEESGVEPREICRQVATALIFLHKQGVCHGDFRPGNILMQVDGIDGLTKDQVLDVLGKPDLRYIEEDPTTEGSWPEYCVVPVPSHKWAKLVSPKIAVVDFGESFLIDDPNERCGIPFEYAAPEILFDGRPGIDSDMWSLACTLYEIRSDRSFFGSGMLEGEMFDMVAELELPLGALPEPYRATWYERGYGAEIERHGRKKDAREERKRATDDPVTLSNQIISRNRDRMLAETKTQTIFQAIVGEEREVGQWDSDSEEDLDYSDLTYYKYRYSKQEIIELADLLKSMLKWQPQERITSESVLKHPWLHRAKANCTTRYMNAALLLTTLLVIIITTGIMIHLNRPPRGVQQEYPFLCRFQYGNWEDWGYSYAIIVQL